MRRKDAENVARALDEAEDVFRAKLIQALQSVPKSGINYFSNSEYNPHGLLPSDLNKDAETFLYLAKDCLTRRDILRAPTEDTVGDLYMYVCSEAADLSNENRRGFRELSSWLVQELQSDNPSRPKKQGVTSGGFRDV